MRLVRLSMGPLVIKNGPTVIGVQVDVGEGEVVLLLLKEMSSLPCRCRSGEATWMAEAGSAAMDPVFVAAGSVRCVAIRIGSE